MQQHVIDQTIGSDPHPDEDPRWLAVIARDRSADGAFYYSVESTGIYCRPGCGARRPNRRNVRFHESCDAAERAGYRACLRCRPSEADHHARLVANACRTLTEAETPPSLAVLAERAGISPFHFHRIFKRVTGVTPRAYATAARTGRVRLTLAAEQTVTAAIYAAGFNASSRFYAASGGILGMTPTRYRAGGQGEALSYATARCSLGVVLVAATDKGIAAIELGDDADHLVASLRNRFPNAMLVEPEPAFTQRLSQVVAWIEQPRAAFDLPLDIRGTAFQLRVWQALRDIPPGRTASYREIAERIGAPAASRAVARACAANPLAVAIPCHRVVRADSTLSGYRWGAERKRALLERERG